MACRFRNTCSGRHRGACCGKFALRLARRILVRACLCATTGLRSAAGVRAAAFVSDAARSLGRGDTVATLPPSIIYELDELNVANLDASRRLQSEMRSRAEAESDRNTLLVLEKNARAKAEQQNSAKDEFLAMLGHELRNPLSAVTSAVSILESGRPLGDGVVQRTHAVLRRQTGHLRKLVDDLLEVNRALMGKLTLDKAPTDLAAVTQRCIDTLQAGGRTDGFELRVCAEPTPVLADPTRLLQVIDNILDNAIKYSPAGGLIDVTVRSIDGHAELQVRDSGLGINPELLPSVFDVFVQGAQSLQRAQGGLGIGLSLVRRLVGMHEGSVTPALARARAASSLCAFRCWPAARCRRRRLAPPWPRMGGACC